MNPEWNERIPADNRLYPPEPKSQESVYGFQADFLLCMVIVMCTVGQGIQIGLEELTGFGFNMFLVELVFLGAFLLLNFNSNLLLNNNLYLLIFTFFAYGLSFMLNPTKQLSSFFNEFLLKCLCGVVASIFVLNYSLLIKCEYYASILGVAVAVLQIVRGTTPKSNYMSFGFDFFFALSYFILYSFQKKHKPGVIIGVGVSMLLITYSSRSCWILLAILFGVMIYTISANVKLKVIATVGITAFLATFETTMLFLLDFLEKYVVTGSSYSLSSIRKMLLNGISASVQSEDRGGIYLTALENIVTHPIGMGIGGFSKTGINYPHNIFLDIWVTFGLMLGTFLMFLVGKEVAKAMKHKKSSSFYLVFIWLLINSFRMLSSHSFVCDPTFFMLTAICINGTTFDQPSGGNIGSNRRTFNEPNSIRHSQ